MWNQFSLVPSRVSLPPHWWYSLWNSPRQNTGVGSLSLLQGIFPSQGSNLGFLSAEPLGQPKNTGVGSLSLLQQIFPTQELNWGLLHCRWNLYQLSHVGNPGTHSIQPYRFSVEFHVWTSNLREITLCRERTQIPLKQNDFKCVHSNLRDMPSRSRDLLAQVVSPPMTWSFLEEQEGGNPMALCRGKKELKFAYRDSWWILYLNSEH